MLRSEFDKKKKLYTIGCSLYSFETKYSPDGIYTIGEYGLPFITKREIDFLNNKNRFIVFTNPVDAQKYVQYLARLYRDEFRRAVKRGNHTKMGKFYVRKIPYSFLSKTYISYSRTLKNEEKFKGNPQNGRIVSFGLLENFSVSKTSF